MTTRSTLIAVVCGTCRTLTRGDVEPDGCRGCRAVFAGDVPRALVSIEMSVVGIRSGVRVGGRTLIDFQGVWTLEERAFVERAIFDDAEGAKRVEPLRLVHGGKR